ncbi:uncharacterized protein LOC103480717 [Poecilia reticulata]|uniref:uncharacterized protein LOC103480717 n=1 Tax=Poecilia reticulata TaxID=8081 RepID=UPI0004A48783|nr:PREDICTED: uncharacterized protein LOC103480717 [Poecilia reticulata]
MQDENMGWRCHDVQLCPAFEASQRWCSPGKRGDGRVRVFVWRKRRRKRRSPAVDGWHSTLEQTDDVNLHPLPPADCVFGGPFISGNNTSSTKLASQSPTQEPRALSVHPASPSAALSIIIEAPSCWQHSDIGIRLWVHGGEEELEEGMDLLFSAGSAERNVHSGNAAMYVPRCTTVQHSCGSHLKFDSSRRSLATAGISARKLDGCSSGARGRMGAWLQLIGR